ncbi:MAG TPA: IS3 family transposase [Vicinamibacterales bacterium]|nr:IS3 family transposase [Vicinamibacterales bacterium]
MAETRSRRSRRRFTDEFKQQAVRLVLDEGKSVTAVARDLDLVASALGNWVKQAQADRSKGRTGLTTAEREELVRLRKALRIAEEERDILGKSNGVLREAEPMRFAFIAAKRAEHRVTILCRCMRVTRSGFYAWCRRGLSARAQRDLVLRTKLRAFHAASGQVYGRPRLWKDLHEDGEAVSEKRVKRLMREEQIQGKVPKRFKQTTNSHHNDPIAANVLDRDFTAAAPNQRWVGDTTEFVIGEHAKLYLAAILDLYSRFVVGWAISAVNDRRLTLKALEMAVQRRCPEPGLLHHSDRGCTYTCEDYQRYLATHGITCSMSRRADCYDNAVMESFFATVKKEQADRFPSYSDAKMALFDYIEVFYNQRRRHSTLGQVSPAKFEREAAA